MAVTVALAALAAGVPAGVACGRLAWEFFAGQLGVQPVTGTRHPGRRPRRVRPDLAVAVAAVPGARASRARPAAIVRAE